jgi:hypothetical protein
MKKSALLLSFVFVAGFAVADEAKKPEAPVAAPAKVAAEAKPAVAPAVSAPADAKVAAKAEAVVAGKTHEVAAEIVSADAVKNTLTIKGEKADMTVPVEGEKAQASLKTVKAGDKVTLTCQDDAKGAHKSVIAIAAAPVVK